MSLKCKSYHLTPLKTLLWLLVAPWANLIPSPGSLEWADSLPLISGLDSSLNWHSNPSLTSSCYIQETHWRGSPIGAVGLPESPKSKTSHLHLCHKHLNLKHIKVQRVHLCYHKGPEVFGYDHLTGTLHSFLPRSHQNVSTVISSSGFFQVQ